MSPYGMVHTTPFLIFQILTDTGANVRKWTRVFSTQRWVILVARTRRKKKEENSVVALRSLLNVFACGQVSSPRLYRSTIRLNEEKKIWKVKTWGLRWWFYNLLPVTSSLENEESKMDSQVPCGSVRVNELRDFIKRQFKQIDSFFYLGVHDLHSQSL